MLSWICYCRCSTWSLSRSCSPWVDRGPYLGYYSLSARGWVLCLLQDGCHLISCFNDHGCVVNTIVLYLVNFKNSLWYAVHCFALLLILKSKWAEMESFCFDVLFCRKTETCGFPLHLDSHLDGDSLLVGLMLHRPSHRSALPLFVVITLTTNINLTNDQITKHRNFS